MIEFSKSSYEQLIGQAIQPLAILSNRDRVQIILWAFI